MKLEHSASLFVIYRTNFPTENAIQCVIPVFILNRFGFCLFVLCSTNYYVQIEERIKNSSFKILEIILPFTHGLKTKFKYMETLNGFKWIQMDKTNSKCGLATKRHRVKEVARHIEIERNRRKNKQYNGKMGNSVVNFIYFDWHTTMA